jgi:hypothetical protein
MHIKRREDCGAATGRARILLMRIKLQKIRAP